MKNFVIAAVISLGFAASAQAAPALKGDAAAGQTKAAACAGCHGADGNSMAPTFPRLAGQNTKYFIKQINDFKTGRRIDPTMQATVAALSDQDIADLAAYFAEQKPGVGAAKANLVKLGEKLYRGGNGKTGLSACAGCHGPDGKGVAGAGFPQLGGQQAAYVTKQLQAFRAAGRSDHVDPAQKRGNDAAKAGEQGAMQMIAAKLSDDEIEALASFISGLH